MLEIREDQLEALRASVRREFPASLLAALDAESLDATRDASGAVVATDARGLQTSLSFAPDGSPQRLRFPSGEHYDLATDDAGRLTAIEHSGGDRAQIEYDALGLVKTLRRPGIDEHRFAYDDQGNLASVRYPDGSHEAFEHDGESRLTTHTARNGARTEYARKAGLLQAICDPLGRETTFEYDGDALQSIVFADGTRETYGFDADEGLGLVTRRDGSSVFQGLSHGAVTNVSWDDGSYINFDLSDGRLHGAVSDTSFVRFDHDARGEMIREKTADGVVKLGHDPEGRISSIVTPTGDNIQYAYDADGRLEAVSDWQGRKHRFQYGKDGAVSQIAYGNGLVERQHYGPAGRLGHARIREGKRVISEQKYGYDICGRLNEFKDVRDGWQRSVQLDIDGRVTRVVDDASHNTEAFEYDAKGNMVRDGGADVVVGPMDQILRHGDNELRYDGLGNVIEMPSAFGVMHNRYGANGLLLETRVGETTIEYEYDALGRRIGKTDGSRTWRYGYHGHQLLWEEVRQAHGVKTVRRDYLWCPDGVVPIAFREHGRTYWIQADSRGAPIRVFAQDGTTVWSARYDAFGRAQVDVERVRQPWRLPGQYHDAETGLHYQLCRYYAPWLKTYLARDPFWHKGGATNYSYAGNRSFDMVDPFGGFAFLAIAAIAVGVGALVGAVVGGVITAAQGGSLSEIAGAAAAGALEGAGAVVGAVVGGLVGGPVGMVAGGMAGAAVGTFAGALAEQAINGDPICLKCAAKRAAVGLLFDVALLGLGRIPGVKRLVRAVGDKLFSKSEPMRRWAKTKLDDLYRKKRAWAASREGRKWGKDQANVPDHLKMDPKKVEADQKLFQERIDLLDGNYKKAMAGEIELPPHITKERLKLAVEGDVDGVRVPLNWKDRAQMEKFQAELKEELAAAGIHDAKVVQIGSATTGWQGNPKKIPPKFWSTESDVDFAIYSPTGLQQAKAAGAPINTKAMINGKYSIVKNTGGFDQTPSGDRLGKLSKKWDKELYGGPVEDGVDFKLNLLDEPLPMSTSILP